MNTAIEGLPYATLKDVPGVPILAGIQSKIKNNEFKYEISAGGPDLSGLKLLSPELGDQRRDINIERSKNGSAIIIVSLDKINVYAVAQG